MLVGLIVVTLIKRAERAALQREAFEAALAAANAPREVVVVDPWQDREADALAMAQALRINTNTGRTTLGARVESQALAGVVELYAEVDPSDPAWRAARVYGSVYEVVYASMFHGVEFGPRWLVQLDPDGPRPEGSGGVVPTNALALWLHREDLEEDARFLNRSDEVVQALTEHVFDGGVRLGSALLVYFLGRGDADPTTIVGWTVVPEEIEVEGDLVYMAYFQWYEGEVIEDAIWQVVYRAGQPTFRARDQRADEIMNHGRDVDEGDLIDIRPMSLRDVDTPPDQESEPRRRSVRYVLADERIVEAVGALLAYRDRTTDLEYVRWHADFVDDQDRTQVMVAYEYIEDGVEQRVAWVVDATTGTRTPHGAVAELAEIALRVYRTPTAPEAPEEGADGDGGQTDELPGE